MTKEIAKHIISAQTTGKKIKIILGDVLRIRDVAHPKRLVNKSGHLSEKDHEKLWLKYEKVRFITNNECPSSVYFIIHKLCNRGIVDSLITTNYDQYLESISEKIPSTYNLVKNPILSARESYDWEGYYSKIRAVKKNSVKFFKIHGSFGHVIFNRCKGPQAHIFQLPKFLTAFSTKRIRKELEGSFYHFSLNYLSDLAGSDCTKTGYYMHFIDWLLKDRKAFEKEIVAAAKDIREVSNAEMVLSLGFTGRPDEELNEVLLELANSNFPIFYVISKTQLNRIEPRRDYLYHRLRKVISSNIIIVDDFDEFLRSILKENGEDTRKLLAEYRLDWQTSNIFVPTSEIGGYAK